MSINSTINALIADVLNLNEDEVNGELSPENTEYWDSMAHLTMVTAIEEECDVKLTMNDVQSIKCVDDIYQIVQKYMA